MDTWYTVQTLFNADRGSFFTTIRNRSSGGLLDAFSENPNPPLRWSNKMIYLGMAHTTLGVDPTSPAASNLIGTAEAEIDNIRMTRSPAIFAPKPLPTKPLPPKTASAEGLVLVVHGHRSSPDEWAEAMASNIAGRISQPDDWDVMAYDWSAASDNSAFLAVDLAKRIGKRVGEDVVLAGYERVHFYAHGPGCWLIRGATATIKAADASVQIQETFFDAYTPTFLRSVADWAEHYAHTWGEADTGNFINGADTIDVTRLNPEAAAAVVPHPVTGVVPPMPNSDARVGHPWPQIWYAQTVAAPESYCYGFTDAIEYIYPGAKSPQTDDGLFRYGHDCDTTNGVNISISSSQAWVGGPGFLNHSNLLFGMNTQLYDVSTKLMMASTTGGTAWVSFPLLIDEFVDPMSFFDCVNGISFEVAFSNVAPGTGSVFSVYWNGEPVFQLDEEGWTSETTTYQVRLPESVTSGVHHVTFRADQLSNEFDTIDLRFLGLGCGATVFERAPVIEYAGMNISNQPQIVFFGSKGMSYTLERSSDLKTWTEVAPVTGEQKLQVIRDPSSEPGFYRIND
ncbi:MAG: hypothetical protein AAF492_03660 [Verrucomicrobiota bacterium]